jgi:alpha-ketoglutarate-dependent taurine dioxygenase
VRGVFAEQRSDRHVAMRQLVLRRQEWYPAPGTRPAEASSVDLAGVFALLSLPLTSCGVAAVQLDRTLGNADLVALSGLFGQPQEQLDDRLADHVEDRVILNLRADLPETSDRTWRLLFAENYVMAHTELAFRLVSSQVRYLLFQCVIAPARDRGGQTLLFPMEDVRAQLTDREASILRATRPAEFTDPPPFLSTYLDRDVFAFKDAEGDALPWRYDGDDAEADEVNGALAALLTAIYQPQIVRGVEWREHLLVAFDNTRFLHGRTFCRRPAEGTGRHLREVRVFRG